MKTARAIKMIALLNRLDKIFLIENLFLLILAPLYVKAVSNTSRIGKMFIVMLKSILIEYRACIKVLKNP